MAMALASFYRKVPVAHVEAGLRTADRYSPFPEEMNRRLIGELASLHFAPTMRAAENLARQGIPASSVHVTGNTGIDALFWMQRSAPPVPWLDSVARERPIVLLTVHRRENHGEPLRTIFGAVRALAQAHPEAVFVFPVHPNPKVVSEAEASFHGVENIWPVAPLDYRAMAAVLRRCTILLTDSGGLQEEGSAAGKPVLVLRETTERPEAVECGGALLVGARATAIFEQGSALLAPNSKLRSQMEKAPCPFGDGKASPRIVRHIENFFRLEASKNDYLPLSAARGHGGGAAMAHGRVQ
jgi:UDP-N-acetylglucosamine 2-epimerase (non-hydrolysing)